MTRPCCRYCAGLGYIRLADQDVPCPVCKPKDYKSGHYTRRPESEEMLARRTYARNWYRQKHGIPLDAPLHASLRRSMPACASPARPSPWGSGGTGVDMSWPCDRKDMR